jgi:excisionase family DNA binding protein
MKNGFVEGNTGTHHGPVRVKVEKRFEISDGRVARGTPISKGGLNESVLREKLMTPDEVAMLVGVKMSWVMDHVTRVEPIIPHIRLGKMIRFKREAVLTWLDSLSSTKPTWERSGDED